MTGVEETAFRQLSGRTTTVEWEIKGFRNLPFENGKNMLSPIFWVSNSNWQISFYPKGDTSAGTEYVSLYLCNLSNYPVEVIFTLLIKVNNSVIAKFYSERTFDEKIKSWGRHRFAERSKILECLKPETSNDTIIVGCSIWIQNSIKEVSTQTLSSYRSSIETVQNASSQTEVSAIQSTISQTDISVMVSTSSQTTFTFSETNPNHFLKILSEDLLKYLNDHTDTDCILKTEGSVFHAHKLILSLRSEVFRAMFRHADIERREFEFPDLQASTLDDILYYIYSGRIRGLSTETAASIFVASDTYGLLHLRDSCLEFLIHNLTVENVCHAADIAHLYAEDTLEREVVRFVKSNMTDVIESNEWVEYSGKKPLLAQRILSKALRENTVVI